LFLREDSEALTTMPRLPLALCLLARGAAAQNSTATECSQSWCTSPDGYGGDDCWAGSYEERCTCSQGEAVIEPSDATLCVDGIVEYEYTCCVHLDDNTHADGERCANVGDHWEQCSLWTGFSFLRVLRFFLFPLFVIIALGSWAQRRRRMIARRQQHSYYNSPTPGAARNAPIPGGIQMPVGFGNFISASAAQPVQGVPVTGVAVASAVSNPDGPTAAVAVPVSGIGGGAVVTGQAVPTSASGGMVVAQAVAVPVAATPRQ